MSMRRCCGCKLEKDIGEFNKNISRKDGLQNLCRSCCVEYSRTEEQRLVQKKYRETPEYSEKRKKIRNTEKYREYARGYAKKYRQRDYVKQKRREYEATEKRVSQKAGYFKDRLKRDKKFHVSGNIRSYISGVLSKRSNRKKEVRKWEEHLGYKVEELIKHLEKQFEPWMTWENYGKYKVGEEKKWHIDHIKPVSSFSFTSYNDPGLKECWALENLQPKEAVENIKKGNRNNDK